MKRFAFIAVAVALFCALPQAEALVRSPHIVARAIELSAPRLSKSVRLAYARVMCGEGKRHHFDPLTMVSIVHYESKFNAHAVNANPPREFSVGLAQINVLANRRACQSDLKGPKCQAVIASLMDGSHNLKTAAALITANRRYCRRRTGQPALFARWLSVFQGYERRRGIVCNMRKVRGRWHDLPPPPKTQQVMRYRRQLIRRLRI